MIDLHSHLVPGVDDGAATVEESRAAIAAMMAQGVESVVTTPHIDGELTLSPGRLAARLDEIDTGFELLRKLAQDEFPEFVIRRGAEIRLDTPRPDFSDPRLRLAGTSFVLVEFAGMMIPPRSAEVLKGITKTGYRPLLAHPERYSIQNFEHVVAWKEAGALLQVNAGSALGWYGDRVRTLARRILAEGLAEFVASDFHARGEPALTHFAELLQSVGAERQLAKLTSGNPARLVQGEEPLPVEPIPLKPRRWFGLRRA
jgi:protein-tyrosine phosphatase